MTSNKWLKISTIIMIYGSLFLLNSCSVKHGPVCIKNNIPYGVVKGIFRETPDDYFERGLSYIQGGCYDAALSDFKEAIKKEPNDQRMYNTYGMHFLNYFPHRESGMLYYFLKDYDAAINALNRSITMTPSLKAFYYRDQVRKEMIMREKLPISRPEIILYDHSNDIWTNQTQLIMSGKAKDVQYISSLKIGPNSIFFKGARQTLEFKEELLLEPGTHTIDIIATNLMEATQTQTLTIHVDKTGPQIIIDQLQKSQRLKGWVSDDSGEISLFINDRKIFQSTQKDMPFSCLFTNDLHLKAVDRAGNITNMVITQKDYAQYANPCLIASNNAIYASDANPVVNISEKHPVIQLELKAKSAPLNAYQQTIQLKGNVNSKQKIVQLTVNGQSILKHSGFMVQINHCVCLKKGKNSIKIMARDASGNAQIKHLQMIYQVPEVYQLHHRLGLSAYPFDLGQDVQQGLLSRFLFQKPMRITDKHAAFLGYFIQDLQQKKRFQLRLRHELTQVLKTCSQPELTIHEPEHPFPSQLMIQGNIFESNTGIEITGMVINIQTSQIITVIDVFDPNSTDNILNQLANHLSKQLHDRFPVAKGIIQKVHSDSFDVLLSKGEILKNQWFYVCKPKTIDRHLGTDLHMIGKGIVIAPITNGFEGKMLETDRFMVGDIVIGM